TSQGNSDVLRGDGAQVEVLEGVGEPVELPASDALAQLVPLPRVTFTVARRSASGGAGSGASGSGGMNRTPISPARGPAAAELILRFPAAKVAIRGAAEVGALGTQSLLNIVPGPTGDTVRVSL